MAAFTVANGDDWLQPFDFGFPGDRWRLDDYDIYADFKAPGSDVVLITASTLNGKLIITDAVARRAEINVGWSEISDTGVGTLSFDLYLINRGTERRTHSEIHTLTIRTSITYVGA